MLSTKITLVMTTSRTVLMSVPMSVAVLVVVVVGLWLRLGLAILSPTSNALTPESVNFPEMWSSL